MTTNVNQGTNRVEFADGVGLSIADLNQLSILATQRAWDAPGYANLLAFDVPLAGYGSIFTGSSVALPRGVFTIGGGLVAQKSGTPLRTYLDPGFAGLWDETRNNPPLSTDTAPRMSWAWASGDWTHDHPAASSGKTRYDIVHCALVRTDKTATRHLKDATTGAKTSQTTVVGGQLALDISITEGAESSGVPTPPTLASGRHVLYMARVSDTVITEVHDLVIPMGAVKTGVEIPASSAPLLDAQWTTAGSLITSTGIGNAVVQSPAGLRGNPSARILGVKIAHQLKTGDTVALVQYHLASGGYGTNQDITSQLTISGVSRDEFVDLRGLPAISWSPMAAHGNGAWDRATLTHNFAALHFASAASGSVVVAVTWYWVE